MTQQVDRGTAWWGADTHSLIWEISPAAGQGFTFEQRREKEEG